MVPANEKIKTDAGVATCSSDTDRYSTSPSVLATQVSSSRRVRIVGVFIAAVVLAAVGSSAQCCAPAAVSLPSGALCGRRDRQPEGVTVQKCPARYRGWVQSKTTIRSQDEGLYEI
jgi:hypothetical protein